MLDFLYTKILSFILPNVVKSEDFNLSYVNCEMASFVHMREHRNFYTNPNGHGMILQVKFVVIILFADPSEICE